MDPRKEASPDESIDVDPYISDTRQYSDFVMYLAKSGRFQHNNLLDKDRRKGVLQIFQSERIIKLTRERRLSPVNVAFTPGGRKERVYLIATVRSGVGQEELDQLVEMMNNHIDGLTTDEKEHAVVDLIFSTGSRVLPGIRYLPLHWYPAGGQHPPTEIIDEANRNVDGEGLPIVDTDEETVAVVQGAGSAKRNHKDDVPMPSTSANLSDASTDSERGPGHYKKKRRAAPITWNTEEDRSSEEKEPVVKKSKSQDILENPQPSTSRATQDDVYVDENIDSDAPFSDNGQEVITREDLNRELAKVVSGFGELKEFVQQIADNKSSKATSTAKKTATRGDTPEYCNEAENNILALFPINRYTEPIDWMIRQPIVQDLIYYDVMRDVYEQKPVFKPESNFVLDSYMDKIISQRLQTHMGKATVRASKHDYSRFPMPMVFLEIAQDKLAGLGKLRAPGTKDVADFMKDRCNNGRRFHVIESDYIEGSASVQEMAHRLLSEREEFISKHKWIFDKIKQKAWTFMDELKKCRKLKAGQKKPDDPSFRGASIPLEQNIETFIFPDMDKGQEILDMDFAHKLVADLEASGVTKPTFPRHVWDTIKMVVQPSPLDVANAQKSLKTKDANRTARNARRRQVYASKVAAQAKATMDEPESAGSDHDEDDPDEQEMDDIEDEQQQLPEGEGEDAPASHTGGAYNLPPLSRKDHVRGLFGSTSDISSTDSNDQDQDDVNVEIRDDGTIVFKAKEATAENVEKPGPSSEAAQQDTGTLDTTNIFRAAEDSGLIPEDAHVMVTSDKSATTNQEFSIVVRSPKDDGPTVVTGETSQSTTAKETLTKPPQKKTSIQRYEDMEESVLDQKALEGRSSSSSSSEEAATNRQGVKPKDAIGGVAQNIAVNSDHVFKQPLPVKRKRTLLKSAILDDGSDFKAPFKAPRPIKDNNNHGHSHGTRSKSAATKKTKDNKGKSKSSNRRRK